ncbi:MAG: peptidylprolyl isomerase [Nanoarchaeota archaeon]|nr:peptidylprolyl isomerase [Nanoarchaeota archaeon]MCA9497155.1 peptidylprolyl isomerase [Nanoarchaeota archaeon]
MEIQNDKLVKIHYKGTLKDGSVFDSSEGKDPLEFIFGLGMIIPGLEEGIKGLKAGDKKTIEIPSEKAYGPEMPEAKQEVPKDQFPADIELKEGLQLAAQGPHGVIPVVVREIKDETVLVDFNHPLAGKDLTFEVEVTQVSDATDEDRAKFMPPEHMHDHEHHHHEHGEGECCGSGKCSSEGKDKKDGECCGSGNCK